MANLTKRPSERKKELVAKPIVLKGKGERNSMNTRISAVQKEFLVEQEVKGNSTDTLRYYKSSFRRMNKFIAQNELPQELLEKVKEDDDLISMGEKMPLGVLLDKDFEVDFKRHLEESGCNPRTINTYFRAYRAFAYYCMDEGWIPVRKISIKTSKAPIKQVYSEEELKKLLKKPKTSNFTEYRNWVVVNYMLATGNRLSSIVALNIEDVDLENSYINVNTQKNKRPVAIPLVKQIRRILKEYITLYRNLEEDSDLLGTDPLFCNRFGERLTGDGLINAISKYNKNRGVTKTSIHLFRHTFAKDWILRGGDLFSLQKMLGHSSLDMVKNYANLYSRDIKDKAEEFSFLSNTKRTSGETIKMRK